MTTTTPTRESVQTIPSSSTASTDAIGARFAAAAGVAFVVLTLASTFAAGSPPASDASAAKIATYFHDHSGGIRAQLLLGGLGIAALLWWFGTLWRLLSRAENDRPRLAVVAALAFYAGTIGSVTDGHGVVVVGLVAFFVWCVWILAVSATMWRTADTAA